MKHFINERDAIVTDAIEAAVMLGNGKLTRLDGFPSIKVVVRADWDRDRDGATHVAMISGGGSGHEPAHVGFVGDGILTAAVCGEIFASPSVDAVLAAILAVTGSAGCLLVVKNYTGDRLNFGLAAEKARAMGLDVEMVIVGDDIALANAPHPRGVAGTLFVHKVAGHLARSGASLLTVKVVGERVASATASIGLSLSSCTIPGQVAESRMRADEAELGLGIHGEPGAEKIALAPIRELAQTMAARIEAALQQRHVERRGVSLALLINDLGGVPPIEMAIATHALLEAMTTTNEREVAIVFGPDRLMTSLDMKGLSMSVLPLDEEIERALLSPVSARAWPSPSRISNEGAAVARPLARSMALKEYVPSANPERRRVVELTCTTLAAMQTELDALDAKVGDGDTGTTLATAARAILEDLDRLPFAGASMLCAALADRLSRVMGGSSGILLSIFIAAMGRAVTTKEPPSWHAALREGVDRLQLYGGAKLGDRTMLDALIPALDALDEGRGDLSAAASAARKGADATASMTKAKAGRSSYVRAEALRGVSDPGAVAVAAVFEALSRSLPRAK